MRVVVNGEARDLGESTSVADLLASLALQPRRVAIELNRAILPRRRYAETRLNEDDALEIVTLVGGG